MKEKERLNYDQVTEQGKKAQDGGGGLVKKRIVRIKEREGSLLKR